MRAQTHHPDALRIQRLRGQRGATVLSTLLLVVAMSTVGLLAMRNTSREVVQSGQLVARERALLVAQAAASLAASQYAGQFSADGGLLGNSPSINTALTGQGNTLGCSACGDCIPGVNYGAATTETGQRNRILAGDDPVDCGGRPCMRQGAVAFLSDSTGVATAFEWCNTPFRDIVSSGDPEAVVTVWIRNNASDALSAAGTASSGSWTADGDGRVTVTAMATVRNSTVTIEEEVLLGVGYGTQAWNPQTADEGYGSGHNNDNTSGSRCSTRSVNAG